LSQSLNHPSKQPDWKPERCYSCGFGDFRWLAKHEDWACNVCKAAQFKPKTPDEIQARQQREAREELSSAIAHWGRANNRNWNPTELRAVTEALEQFLRRWECNG
jgi:uncharacterized Zn finger protein (UPF0148 family)